jgi:hypothetical protein
VLFSQVVEVVVHGFPSGVRARLDALLDKQDESGLSEKGSDVSEKERDEPRGLVDLADVLGVLRLRAQRFRTGSSVPTYSEHDVVVLRHDLPNRGLIQGEVGNASSARTHPVGTRSSSPALTARRSS